MSVVQIAHGGGGKLTEDLIKEVFVKTFDNEIIDGMEDSAIINLQSVNLAFTIDSYTVKPLFFPGGDIGKLAVYGTVNDLLMRGARPLFLSASFIIEEGFEIEGLKAVATSMAGACQEARVSIVTGDTKVVAKGEADQLFINTSGVWDGSLYNIQLFLGLIKPGNGTHQADGIRMFRSFENGPYIGVFHHLAGVHH
jgi:hydrogenase expression/formation protein HypE